MCDRKYMFGDKTTLVSSTEAGDGLEEQDMYSP